MADKDRTSSPYEDTLDEQEAIAVHRLRTAKHAHEIIRAQSDRETIQALRRSLRAGQFPRKTEEE